MGQGTRSALLAAALAAAAFLATAGWANAETQGRHPRLRILDAAGRPVAGARVSLVGRSGSVTSDGEGRFSLSPFPRLPFLLAVHGSDGEWLGILSVTTLPEEDPVDLRLTPLDHVEVTVESGVSPSTLAPPAAGSTVLTRKERVQRSPARVAELLEEIPGAEISGSGHPAVPSLRGLSRGRTLVLLDDARITTERRAGASATFLDPFSLESLEVVRGPGTVLYGSDALGGILHGRTPVPATGYSARFETGAGTKGEPVSAAAEVNLPAGRGGILVQAHQRSFAEYDSPEGEVRNSGARDRGLLARWVLPTKRGRWILGYQIDQGRDVGKPRDEASGSATRYPEEDSARLTASAFLSPGGPLESLEIHLFAGRYALVTERQAIAGPEIERSDVEASDASLRLIASLPAGGGTLRFGLDARSRHDLTASNFSVSMDPNLGRTTAEVLAIESAGLMEAGLFGEGRIPLSERLTLAAGIRGQGSWAWNSGGEAGDDGRSDATLTGYAAATLELGSGWQGSLQAARGFREPTLSDRYFTGVTGRGRIEGNPDLDPEFSRQFDLSILRTTGRVRLAAYLYHYTIEDLIERFRAPPDPNMARRSAVPLFGFRNRGEAEIQGLEVEMQWQILKDLSGRLVYGQARGTELDGGDPLDDIPSREIRAVLGRAGASRVWWRIEYAHRFADVRPGPDEAVTSQYGLLDLSGGLGLGGGLEARLVAANVLDRRHPASAEENPVPGPGRAAALYLSGRF